MLFSGTKIAYLAAPAHSLSRGEGAPVERVKLYCEGECRGEVVLRPEGSQVEVHASMPDPGGGLYRTVLLGSGGELLVGVMEPCGGGALSVRRRMYKRDLDGLGTLRQGEARCSFRFDGEDWQETGCPAKLFQEMFLRRRLEGIRRAWWRREGELLRLALPLKEGTAFPLEALFCLAKIERVAGNVCAVYTFQGEEPVLPSPNKV